MYWPFSAATSVTAFFTLRAKHSGAVYCNRSCLWRADDGRVGGVRSLRTLLQPARAPCLRLSERFFICVCFY